MHVKSYILLTSIIYGYYWICCIAQLSTSNINDWYNICICSSMILSVIYFLLLKYWTIYWSKKRTKIQFMGLTGLCFSLLIISNIPPYKDILNDINSKVFSIVYFTGIGIYGLLLIFNVLFFKLELVKNEEQFIEMV